MSSHAIIAAWLAVERIPGATKTGALADLNEALGTGYTLSRIGEWRSGVRPMPPPVRAHMLAIGVGVLLHKHGIPAKYDRGSNYDLLAIDLA